jgi:nitrogen fixation protein NifU and related proteins
MSGFFGKSSGVFSMSLDDLYKQMILEHNKHPRNFGEVEPCTHYSHGKNPLCGDDYIVTLRLSDDKIEDIGFKGVGCAISKASGSMMTEALKGKTIPECLSLKDDFLELVTQEVEPSTSLGKLIVFEGVKQFPVRVKCAALVWRALEDALKQRSEVHCISTE